MRLLGVTGGVGMGKSACAALLQQRGVPTIDTDQLARQVVEPGQPALAQIQAVFGSDILDSAGRLRRDELGRIVFTDSSLRQKLEAILHPIIRQLWISQAQRWRAQGERLGVVVIPLLFETSAETEFEATICVACTPPTQFSRLQARGWSAQQIHQRIDSQLPVDVKMAKSNFVIWSEGSLEVHAAQLDRILADYS